MIAKRQYEDTKYSGYYNVGPDECDCVTTGQLVDIFCKAWSNGQTWQSMAIDTPHEANFLKLDCSKLKATFNWQPRWHIDKAVEKTVEWAKAWYKEPQAISEIMDKQIKEFFAEDKN